MVSLGVDPVPSSSSTSILDLLSITRREGIRMDFVVTTSSSSSFLLLLLLLLCLLPSVFSFLEMEMETDVEEDLREKEREASDAERGGGISEERPIYSMSSSSCVKRPMPVLEPLVKGMPFLSSAPTSVNNIVHAAVPLFNSLPAMLPPPIVPFSPTCPPTFQRRCASTKRPNTSLSSPLPDSNCPSAIKSPGMTMALDVAGMIFSQTKIPG
mmetsp:Transcript_17410/g.34934  ORF Transcript_17410/g.34934 Transcript_17410/m.34934 type:complete len:212 (-) Transcript_17410:2-637(-)